MRTPYKMKGMDFGNSPVTKKTGNKLPLDEKGEEKEIDFAKLYPDAYEAAVNEYMPGGENNENFTPSDKQVKTMIKKMNNQK